MWRYIIPVSQGAITEFEQKFLFRIRSPFREFLIDHNNGIPSNGSFPTEKRERKLAQFLDFSDRNPSNGATAINQRLREQIGEKRIVVGRDRSGNLVCLERNYKEQYIVVWSHISGEFERSLLDIPALLQAIN